jgi:hypothetical protein
MQCLTFIEHEEGGLFFASHAMLHKCANPACSKLFRKLSEGKLFQVESEYFRTPPSAATRARRSRLARHVEHYWLCDDCCPVMTLSFEPGRGVVAVPHYVPAGKKPPTSPRRQQPTKTDAPQSPLNAGVVWRGIEPK